MEKEKGGGEVKNAILHESLGLNKSTSDFSSTIAQALVEEKLKCSYSLFFLIFSISSMSSMRFLL